MHLAQLSDEFFNTILINLGPLVTQSDAIQSLFLTHSNIILSLLSPDPSQPGLGHFLSIRLNKVIFMAFLPENLAVRIYVGGYHEVLRKIFRDLLMQIKILDSLKQLCDSIRL